MNSFDLIDVAFTGRERNADAELFNSLVSGNARKVMDQLFPRTAVSSAIGPQQPMSRYPDLVEGPSPCADTRTAGVSDLYPVTCEARFYDAASQILEDEGTLAGNPHDNANELGALIEAWIHRARNNREPK